MFIKNSGLEIEMGKRWQSNDSDLQLLLWYFILIHNIDCVNFLWFITVLTLLMNPTGFVVSHVFKCLLGNGSCNFIRIRSSAMLGSKGYVCGITYLGIQAHRIWSCDLISFIRYILMSSVISFYGWLVVQKSLYDIRFEYM